MSQNCIRNNYYANTLGLQAYVNIDRMHALHGCLEKEHSLIYS